MVPSRRAAGAPLFLARELLVLAVARQRLGRPEPDVRGLVDESAAGRR
jgi:hypothetical protein